MIAHPLHAPTAHVPLLALATSVLWDGIVLATHVPVFSRIAFHAIWLGLLASAPHIFGAGRSTSERCVFVIALCTFAISLGLHRSAEPSQAIAASRFVCDAVGVTLLGFARASHRAT